MDLNHFLLWFVGISCGFLLLRAVRLPLASSLGWIVVCSGILIITAVMFHLAPAISGFVGGSLWAILMLLPLMGMKIVNQLFYQERYAQASQLAAIIRWLHPADGWLEQPVLLKALSMGQRGEMEQAMQLLNRYQSTKTQIGRSASAFIYRMGASWEEYLLWLRENFTESEIFQDADLATYYLRSLGEVGDLNRLLQTLERCEQSFAKTGNTKNLNLMRMFALAFCGQTFLVQRLFASSLAMYSSNTRKFWLATAEMVSGNEAIAREQLLALSHEPDMTLGKAIAWRLSHPPVNPQQVLTESSQQILEQIEIDLKQEFRYGRAVTFIGQKAVATYALIGLNLLVFGLEILLGGSENSDTLYHLGALVPTVAWKGEWWRLLNATFLHFGFLHLSMNMLGLYFLGAFVELTLGIWRYLVIYFFSGIGSMLVVTLTAIAVHARDDILVGASGAIMGLIGATGAILFWGWRREKSHVAAQRLRTVLFIVGLQVVFDLNTPQVSFLGHLSGTILGFLVGSVLIYNYR